MADPRIRTAVRNCREALCERLDAKDILRKLYAKELITKAQFDEMMNEKSEDGRNIKLIDHLERHLDEKTFTKFCKILDEIEFYKMLSESLRNSYESIKDEEYSDKEARAAVIFQSAFRGFKARQLKRMEEQKRRPNNIKFNISLADDHSKIQQPQKISPVSARQECTNKEVEDGVTYKEATIQSVFDSMTESVCAVIILENKTDKKLIKPLYYVMRGAIKLPPPEISPWTREFMAVQRKPAAMFPVGSAGLLTWLVEGTDLRLVVMWSIPYSHQFEKSWLAFGTNRSTSLENFGRAQYMDIWRSPVDEGSWFVRGSPSDCKEGEKFKLFAKFPGISYSMYGEIGRNYRETIKIEVRSHD